MKSVRLSKYIKPERYELIIKPDLDGFTQHHFLKAKSPRQSSLKSSAGFTFAGEETIFLKLEKPVREITLHAKELEIRDISFHHPSLTLPIKGERKEKHSRRWHGPHTFRRHE